MIVVFVIGEMLWVPTSQAVVAALAPADIRGAYMGAFGGDVVGRRGRSTPFLGLQVRHAYGDDDDVDVRRRRRRDRRRPRRWPRRAGASAAVAIASAEHERTDRRRWQRDAARTS